MEATAVAARAPRALLALAAAVVVGEVVLQAPGALVAETRTDLALEPAQFLARLWTPWEGTVDMGRVPNQAVGYLFPVGAFHLVGSWLGLPEWLVIRLWVALVLCVALWGLARLADELRIGDPTSRVAAGLAYALSPLLIARVGVTSWFVLGAALAPWAVVPLVRASRGGPIRSRACASALVVFAAGAVNATVTAALVVVPLVFLLTRERGPRRRTLLTWWALACAAVVVWWVGPLLVQSRYGFDFLPFTERASITTAYTSPFEVVRGLGDWLSQAQLGRTPLPAGRELATSGWLVLIGGAVGSLGVAGLAHRAVPARRFLCATFTVGLVVLAAGYAGPLGGPFDGAVRDLLDGPLSPLRTVYKFQALIALPLALGLCHATTCLRRAATRRHRPQLRSVAAVGVSALVVLGAWPLLTGRLLGEAFDEVPTWWHDAADEVAGAPGRVLLAPGLVQGDHAWGFTGQEPFQWLLERPWATRSVAPLGSPEAMEALDTIEAALSTGGDPVLDEVLALDGFSTVVVRNDGRWSRSSAPNPQRYDLALRRSGLRRVASFGPPVLGGRGPLTPNLDLGQVTVYEVPAFRSNGLVTSVSSSTATFVAGDASAAPLLARFGLADRAWTTDAGAVGEGRVPVGAVLVTDTDVRVHTQFGLNRENTSYVLTATEPAPNGSELVQPRRAGEAADQTAALLVGADEVTASSYGSVVRPLPEVAPSKAFDGVADTAWVTAVQLDPVGQWIELVLPEPREVDGIRLRLLDDGPWRTPITRVRVATDTGEVTSALAAGEHWQEVPAAGGTTRSVRVAIDAVAQRPGAAAAPGFREVAVDGVSVERWLALPNVDDLTGGGGPPGYLVQRRQANPADLLRSDEEDELRRVLRVPAAVDVAVRAEIVPEPGPELLDLVNRTSGVEVRASSTLGDLPAFAARNLLDDDPATAWVSAGWPDHLAEGDATGPAGSPSAPLPWQRGEPPSLELTWDGPRTISSLRFAFVDGLSRPTSVVISADGQRRTAPIDRDGVASFEPLTADGVVIELPTVARVTSVDRLGIGQVRPIGITSMAVEGLAGLGFPPVDGPARLELPCGAAGALHVGDHVQPVAASLTLRQALDMVAVPATPCGPVSVPLPAGSVPVRSENGGGVAVSAVALLPPELAAQARPRTAGGPGSDPSPPPTAGDLITIGHHPTPSDGDESSPGVSAPHRSLQVTSWDDDRRRVVIGAGPGSVLVVHENANEGWKATLDGVRLTPLTVGGWQQGYVVPAGAGGEVVLSFTPTTVHRATLVVGLALVALVALSALTIGAPSPSPPIGEGSGRRADGVVAGAAAVVACGVGALALPVLWWLRRQWWSPVLAGGAFLLAAVSASSGPGARGPWPDVIGARGWLTAALAVVAILGVVANLPGRRQLAGDAPKER